MAKSRLGKGLGALFPTISEERVTVSEAAADPAATGEQLARADRPTDGQGTGQAVGGGPANPPASRLVGGKAATDSARLSTAAGSSDGAAAAGSAHDRGTSAKWRKSLREGRVPIPQWDEVAHPSDMFFSSTGSPAVTPEGLTPSARRTGSRPGGSAADVSHETMAADRSAFGRPQPVRPAAAVRAAGEETSAAKAVAALPADTATLVRADAPDAPVADSPAEDGLQEVAGAYLAELSVADIEPNAHQPRTIFDDDELRELAESITEVGVLQPIVVREVTQEAARGVGSAKGVAEKKGGRSEGTTGRGGTTGPEGTGAHYELIMGERRLRASRLAGKETIPAIVRTTEDTNMLRDALLENLHRVQLNPLEEAAAYEQMIKEFGLTQERLARSVSKSRPQIANTLRLLQLPATVQKRVASGVLSAGHARALLGLPSEEMMIALAKRIVAEGLSVRTTEELVALSRGASRQAKPRKTAQNWVDPILQQRLGDRFDTKVSIRGSEQKGRIEIVYASAEDLQRITDLLVGGGLAGKGLAAGGDGADLGGSGLADSSDGWV